MGLVFSLTVSSCPCDSVEWRKTRRAFIRRLERGGLLRLHWVVEWQRRGVPHLHGVAFFEGFQTESKCHEFILNQWLAVTKKYNSEVFGQHIKPVTDAVGWFKYVAKHLSRSAKHYQRASFSIPESWGGLTGRM